MENRSMGVLRYAAHTRYPGLSAQLWKELPTTDLTTSRLCSPLKAGPEPRPTDLGSSQLFPYSIAL